MSIHVSKRYVIVVPSTEGTHLLPCVFCNDRMLYVDLWSHSYLCFACGSFGATFDDQRNTPGKGVPRVSLGQPSQRRSKDEREAA